MNNEDLKLKYIDQYRTQDSTIENNDLTKDLPIDLFETFWEWFEQESKLFCPEHVQWDNLQKKNIEFGPGLCHHNSLKNSILNRYENYCGIIICKSSGFSNSTCIMHSFNVKDEKVLDFTYYHNQTKPALATKIFPCTYIGIEISKSFLGIVQNLISELENQNNARKYVCNYPLAIPMFLYEQDLITIHDFMSKHIEPIN